MSGSSASRFSRLLLVVPLLLLSACTQRTVLGTQVFEDGSGVVSLSMGLDEEWRLMLDEEQPVALDWSDPTESFLTVYGLSPFAGSLRFVEEGLAAGGESFALPEGMELSRYAEDGFLGATLDIPFDSPEAFAEVMSELTGDPAADPPFVLSRKGNRFTFSSQGGFAVDEEVGLQAAEAGFDLSELYELRVAVSLPGRVVEHNADEVLGDGTLVWEVDLADPGSTAPHAVSTLQTPVWQRIIFVAVLVVLVAAVVGVGLLLPSREADA